MAPATHTLRIRCGWCGDDPLYQAYHDEEWGVPCHDDRQLFELLTLEGAQAGLSWITVLRKREAYRRAFEGFEAAKVAAFTAARAEALLQDPGIVRNRLKVASTIGNAQAILASAAGIRHLRCLPLGLRGRKAQGQRVAHAQGPP